MAENDTLNGTPSANWREGQRFRERKSVPHTLDGVCSMLRSVARRDDFDVPDLSKLTALRDALDAAERIAVDNLRSQGHSFTVIGRQLGITRQAARQRFG